MRFTVVQSLSWTLLGNTSGAAHFLLFTYKLLQPCMLKQFIASFLSIFFDEIFLSFASTVFTMMKIE